MINEIYPALLFLLVHLKVRGEEKRPSKNALQGMLRRMLASARSIDLRNTSPCSTSEDGKPYTGPINFVRGSVGISGTISWSHGACGQNVGEPSSTDLRILRKPNPSSCSSQGLLMETLESSPNFQSCWVLPYNNYKAKNI